MFSKKKRSSLRIVLYTLSKHPAHSPHPISTTDNRFPHCIEILKILRKVKSGFAKHTEIPKTDSLNVLKFQERVCANPCKPPESYHWLTPTECIFVMCRKRIHRNMFGICGYITGNMFYFEFNVTRFRLK